MRTALPPTRCTTAVSQVVAETDLKFSKRRSKLLKAGLGAALPELGALATKPGHSLVSSSMVRRQKQNQQKLNEVRGRIAGDSPQQAAVKPFTVALSKAEDLEPSLSELGPLRLAAAKVRLPKECQEAC